MTDLSKIPRYLLEQAAADPRNAHAKESLQRVVGAAPASAPPKEKKRRRGVPNRTEQRFAREVLDRMVELGHLDSYEFEALTFHEHETGTRCTPDFIGWRGGVPVPFEVKGLVVHEASVLRVKLHAAARPQLRWRIYKRTNDGWAVHFDSLQHNP